MAQSTDREKTLEMRVAELEDKLKGLQVTEEEMRAFNKVASLMGLTPQATATPAGDTGGAVASLSPQLCVVAQCIRTCVVAQCIRTCVVAQCIRTCIIQACINECGGGCAPGGGFFSGGFGGLGG